MNLTSIKLTVNGAQAWATVTGPLTSGMVGLPVTIEYDDAWDGLTKNLVCRCSRGADNAEYRTILNIGNTAVVAHEVMKAGMLLYLGIEGFSADGTLVIPTIWVMCGAIEKGANTGEDLSADPTLPVWAQLQTEIEQIRQNGIDPEQLAEVQSCVQSAIQAADGASKAAQSAASSAGRAETAAARAEAANGGTGNGFQTSDGVKASTFTTQPVGELFEQPVNYAFWASQSLRWDQDLGKYVDVIYGTSEHMAGASAHSLWVSYIDPDTLVAEAPVRCSYVDADGNAVSPDDQGTSAWIILDDGRYLLFNFVGGEMYRFISGDHGKTWVQEQVCSGYPSTQELYFLVKLSNGRLLANSCEMKAIARSDDMGITWQTYTPNSNVGGDNRTEINFFEVKPGIVIAIGRYSMSGEGVNSSGDSQHALISFSEDYGETWTDWKLSDTIDNMNASCCTGYVHDGILEIFTGSRWYHRGDNATTDYTNTGKSGAIMHYCATIENALADNFTNLGAVVYAKAQGNLSSQDFHTPCVAVNGKEMLLVYCDRVYPYTEEKTNHYFVRGYLGGSMDYSPKDDIVSTTFPWSSRKTTKELAKLKSELIVLMNEAILSQKPVVPDDGGEGGSYAYVMDGIVANFNMIDASRYDAENLTITDTIHGLTGKLYRCTSANTALTELPTIRDNSATEAAVYFSDNPLADYISADKIEFTLEWSQYRYADDAEIPTSGFHFHQSGFRIAAYGRTTGRYLKTDGASYDNVYTSVEAAGYNSAVQTNLFNRNSGVHSHSVATFGSDGVVRFYKNGVKTVEAAMNDFLKWDPLLLTDAFRMGGYCRSMRIYSRVLTDAEVANNYNYEKQFIVK